MKVSVLTVALNNERTIRQTLESVLSQSSCNIEYILKDGGSTDKTVEIAKSYESQFREKGIDYKIIVESDQCLYDAMNQAIAYSTGDVIGFLNSDDWYTPDCIKIVTEYFTNDQDMEVLDGSIQSWDEDGTYKVLIQSPRLRKFITSRDFRHPTLFVRKQIYEKYQYNTALFYADFDLWIRLRKDNRKIVTVKDVLTNYRLGGVSNKGSLKEVTRRYKERRNVYKNNNLSRWYIVECIFTEYGKSIYYWMIRVKHEVFGRK